MKSKQEVIQEAWLEFMTESDYKNLKIDDNGFCNYQCRRYINSSRWDELYSRVKSFGKTGRDIIYRPKSLSGIETNNGWTRIESEADLPQIAGYDFKRKYFTVVDGKIRDDVIFNVVFGEWRMVQGCKITKMNVTHYMDINIPPLPIF